MQIAVEERTEEMKATGQGLDECTIWDRNVIVDGPQEKEGTKKKKKKKQKKKEEG